MDDRPAGRTRGPLSASLVLASAAHVAVVGWLAWRAPRERPATGAFLPEPSFEVALDEAPAPPRLPDVAFGSNDASPGPVAALPERLRRAAPARVIEAPQPEGSAPAAEAAPATSVAGSEAAAPRNFSLGPLPPSFAWGGSENLPGPRAAPTLSPSAALRDAIARGEQARGLTASGPLLAAARVAANIAAAPAEGSATLSINVGADGSVSSVTVDHGAWKATANALRSALTGRRLQVPAGAAGLSVDLRVEARVTNAPRLLTGEEKVKPCAEARGRLPWGGSPDTVPANTACIDATALLPLRRRLVSVALLREMPR